MTTLEVLKIPGVVCYVSEIGTAFFSTDKKFRYALGRVCGFFSGRDVVTFIGSNPSTADHEKNDMTISKEIGFSKLLGFRHMVKVNLGALVSTDPAGLLTAKDCVGPENWKAIDAALRGSELVIAAWGDLDNRVWEKFRDSVKLVKTFKGIKCLGRTKGGAPRHTSRLGYKAKLEDWP